ncbi:hypothetical protein FHW58_005148 [Duganella sp. 1224]|uniref:BPSS1780 family membrane protein n=1 Tax=Duganella sp. 1224 TaxID=2587052 RepID=UPI0015CC5FAB|nr:BPSS1780 family membrane protein [Duganella sp. 1224]NYE63914.1 hypothetical protein [Duganella sp. 1224]
MEKLPARAGWHWVKQGLQLFRKQPGGLMALLFVCMFSSFFILLLPVIGQIIWCVLMPLFSVALLQGCAEIDGGRRAMPQLLLAGFQSPMRKQLFGLGGINCALMLLAMLAIYGLSGDALAALRAAQAKGAIQPEDVEGLFAGMLTGSAIYMIGWMLTSMTAPLIFWQKMALTKALFFSVVSVLRAVKAFATAIVILHLLYFFGVQLVLLVLGVSSLGVAGIFTLLLISLVMVHCTLFVAYKQLFGTPPALPEGVNLNKP